ncbi:pyridoxal phosphate-dependent aminotransferase [Thalassotalea euphylliae]|uniref:Pyridoxal phosphate-dependent aminotransferase n=1 Tax=Thalassotalea euphylliae TaxID=1655234 RepID=A0A3E0TU64_9GAMM|nr:pyridoxal phosphate-dependent aminotransferase [Thalassotalea euphylliae]REL27990.1 pyridoxal phosphate-dependent aminotransferase [Thalassotalea euphylliae]
MPSASSLPPHIAYTRALAGDIRFNLSHSCGQACSLAELTAMDKHGYLKSFADQPLDYASVQGLPLLRAKIASFHQSINESAQPSSTKQLNTLSKESVVTFSGAQEALMGIYQSLIRPGDEVVVFTPNYPSLTAMVAPLGGKLIEIPITSDKQIGGWQFDIEQLAANVNERTRLVVINAPHNPTGATLSQAQRREVLAIVKACGCYLLSDDVTQPLIYDSALAHQYLDYDKAISVSVMSKSFGLGGVRIGWAVTRNHQLLERLMAFKASHSICTSRFDEQLAIIALENHQLIVENTIAIAKQNITRFAQCVDMFPDLFEWHPPSAGLLTLVKVNTSQPIAQWCKNIAEHTGILLLPSELFGLNGPYFRLGLGQENFGAALSTLESFLASSCKVK